MSTKTKIHELIQKAIKTDGIYLRDFSQSVGSIPDKFVNPYVDSRGGCCLLGALAVGISGLEGSVSIQRGSACRLIQARLGLSDVQLDSLERGFEGFNGAPRNGINMSFVALGKIIRETYGTDGV